MTTNQLPGWSHEIKSAEILAASRCLDGRVVNKQDLTPDDLEWAEAIIAWAPGVLHPLRESAPTWRRHRHKLLIGVTAGLPQDPDRRLGLVRLLQEWAAGVLAINAELVRQLRPLLPVPVFHTPRGVDTEALRPDPARTGSPAGRLRVGWTGSLTNFGPHQRGLPGLLEPAIDLVDGAELVLAAREDQMRTRDQMRDFYNSIDVYASTSYIDGTPNPPLEAGACGIPVLATAVGVMPEYMIDQANGYLVPFDVATLADRLTRLRDDPDLRHRMGRTARHNALTWDWAHRVRAIECAVAHVAGRDPQDAS